MDFNSRFNFDFKKTVITVGIVLLCLVVGIFVYINSRSIEEPVVEPLPNRDLVVDNTPIDTEIEVVEQKKTVGKLIATVKNIRDLSTRIEYDIEVGLGENKTPSIVKATGVTVFYDFYKDKMINPGDIKVGDTVNITVKDNSTDTKEIRTVEVTNVPFKVNYKTNLVGSFLTGTITFNVSLGNTTFGEDENQNKEIE